MTSGLTPLVETRDGLRPEWKPYATSKAVQRALLVGAVGFGVLSLVPPLRFAGSLGLRAVAFLAACNVSAHNWQDGSKLDRALLVGKIALVVLGIVGAVLVSPAMIVASIAVDTGLQIKELLSALKDKEYGKALIHLTMLTVNVLAIAAIVLGSWQLIVAASAISVLLMLCMAVKMYLATKEDPGAWIDVLGYAALAGIGIAGCVTMAQLVTRIPQKATFDLENHSDYTRYVYDKNGLIATIPPGESVHLELSYNDLLQVKNGVGGNFVGVLRIETHDAPWYVYPEHYREPDLTTYLENLRQAPIAPRDIPYTFPASVGIPRQLCSRG